MKNTSIVKASKCLILASLLPLSISATAEDMEDAQTRIGLNLGSFGLGVNVYGNTPWHLKPNDQIQWNITLEGGSIKDEDDIEINKNDYHDVDLDSLGTRAGLNWYPFFGNRFSKNVFFASGLMYSKIDIEANADLSKSYKVDGKKVTKSDIDSLSLDLSSKTVSPYLSVGWGGRISDYKGFIFKTELGASLLKADNDIKLTAKDPSNFLTAQNIENERKNIKDDLDSVVGFVSFTLSYTF